MPNWYAYNGFGDPSLPGSYIKTNAKINCLTGGCMICAIYLDDTANVPSSVSAVLTYIANTLVSLTPQPAEGIPFVYVKNCF